MHTANAKFERIVFPVPLQVAEPTLTGFLDFAESLRDSLLADNFQSSFAAISRIRGTGPGVSFGRLVEQLEAAHPIAMQHPFEGTQSIAGGVWPVADLLSPGEKRGLVKLQFDRGTDQLPMHAHEHSDRVIFVLEGRGFFHVSGQPLTNFDGRDINTVPVRSRDALVFSRGTVHTFSCPDEPLVLLSYHHPFFELSDPGQYTIPECRITPAEITHEQARVACDPAWNVLIATPD